MLGDSASSTLPRNLSALEKMQLRINEIFYSIQGESTYAGMRCVFVRLTGCDLRCTYCDTEYAFYEGKRMTLAEIHDEIAFHKCSLVEITGGEPLLQRNVHPLMASLCDAGYTVLIETSGAHDISSVDSRVHRIMDIKCPSSGEAHRNRWPNIEHLNARDEVKFVIGDLDDYRWAKQIVEQHRLSKRVRAVLFSPVFGKITPQDLATWILKDALPVRFQVQLHKIIWPPDTRGV